MDQNDEHPSICFWNYIFENCECHYEENERAFSASITIDGEDYQAYELDRHSAKSKLATSIYCWQEPYDFYIKEIYGKQPPTSI